jgi:hypothetical protein
MSEARGPRLFVSHSSSKRPVAEHVERALAAKGVTCWVAPRDVAPGASFARAIPEAIRQTDGVLLLFCSDSVKSRHVERELILADQLGKAIIPLRLEKIDPGELSYHLASSQWLDWLEQRDGAIDRIAARAHEFHQLGPMRSSPPVIGPGVTPGSGDHPADPPDPDGQPRPPAAEGAHQPPAPVGGAAVSGTGGSAPDGSDSTGSAPARSGSKTLLFALAGAMAVGLIALVVWLSVRAAAPPAVENSAAGMVGALSTGAEDAADAGSEEAAPQEDAGGEATGEIAAGEEAAGEEAAATEAAADETAADNAAAAPPPEE